MKEDFSAGYWQDLWGWYENGGFRHVTAYLQTLDISGFDAKAPPPKTAAFWNIVDAGIAPEDGELADVIDQLKNPDALTLPQLQEKATGETAIWLLDRRNRRAIPHRLERCGYVAVRNPDRNDGRWIIKENRQTVYAKATLPVRRQIAAASRL